MTRRKVSPKLRFAVDDRQLPFKLSSQSVGVQLAYRSMVAQYGLSEGRRIFLAKANERGVGNTVRQRADSIYTTGRHLPSKKPH